MIAAKTIVAIDDDKLILHMYGELIRTLGYQPVLFSSGSRAWDELDAGLVPDLIILDLVMDGLDGEQLLQKMKDHPILQEVPVVVVSGHLVASAEYLLKQGVSKVFEKPLRLVQVKALLEEIQDVQMQVAQRGTGA